MRALESQLWKFYSATDLSLANPFKLDAGLDKVFLDGNRPYIREAVPDNFVLNLIRKITRYPTLTSLPICTAFGEQFYCEGAPHKDTY